MHDLATTHNYNTILNRVHNKIKLTSRQQIADHYCWFIVPEVMIGVPKYDIGTCIAYIIDKLQTNGFQVRYTHPNMLFISWNHYIPYYERQEYKKKTGVNIDGFGNVIIKSSKKKEPMNINELLSKKTPNITVKNKIDYKNISSYKPSGKFIYDNEMIKTIENIVVK